MLKGPAAILLVFLASAASASTDLVTATKTVAAIRGIPFRHPVAVKSLRRDELNSYFRAQIARSGGGSADDYVQSLRALQLLPPGGDPLGQLLDLYQAQVLAFYSPMEHVYYQIEGMPAGLAGNSMLDQTVELHELMHALQDQAFGAGAILEKVESDWDAQLAYQSVLEGEATLVMLAGLARQTGGSLDDIVHSDLLLQTLANASLMDQSIPKDTPRYYAQSLEFPYAEGLKFVVDTYKRGGWKALDELHHRPPTTSAELLHPPLYFDHFRARAVIAPITTHSAFTVLDSPIGEFHWRFLLGAEVAQAWRGDRVKIVENAGCLPTVLIDSQWSSPATAIRFRDALVRFLQEQGLAPLTSVQGMRVRVSYGAESALSRAFINTVPDTATH